MEGNITIPKEDWQTLVKSVTRMEVLLAGSGFGENGLVADLKTAKNDIQKIKDKDNQRKGVMWVLSILWLGIITIGGWIISKL